MERRLAAILVADVVGYSSAMEANETRALDSIRDLREQMFEPEIANNSGEVVKRLGDGWIAEFQSVVDAVLCAIQVQNNIKGSKDVELRIGIHIGDIIQEEGEIYGNGINVAARLESIGAPGLILVSDDVKRLIGKELAKDFDDLGPIELKNINEPVRVWCWPQAPKNLANLSISGKKPNIFVNKFAVKDVNASELADAIKDDLMTAFVRQSGITVVTTDDKADFKLEGSIRVSNSRWRITARLDNCNTGQTEWSDRFDETGDDLFEIQDQYVTKIAGAVRIRLPELLSRKTLEIPLEELSIEDLLNHAMHCHFTPTVVSWDRAKEALNLTLNRDESNWMAMIMFCFNVASRNRLFGWRKKDPSAQNETLALIEKAVSLKPDSDVVRFSRAVHFLYSERDPNSARNQLQESLRLNPNFYHSINLMSQVELIAGNLEASTELASRAAECDPGYPYLHLYLRDLGYVLMVAGKYEEAIKKFERADMAAPGLARNLIGMSMCGTLAGNHEYAIKSYKKLYALVPEFNIDEYDPWPVPGPSAWPKLKIALGSIQAIRSSLFDAL